MEKCKKDRETYQREEFEKIVKDGIHIFTKGSYKDQRYSWAFVVYKDGELFHTESGIGNDDEMLEIIKSAGALTAVTKAIEWAEEENAKIVYIYSEITAKSFLIKAMCNAHKNTNEKHVNDMFEDEYGDQYENPGGVIFKQIAGDCGILGHELADKLAVQALQVS